jgi:hypothetical protein
LLGPPPDKTKDEHKKWDCSRYLYSLHQKLHMK